MSQKGKVMARIEYEEAENQKVCYGEIEEKKIENFSSGEDGFICIENDGIITWLDKESLISVETLIVNKIIYFFFNIFVNVFFVFLCECLSVCLGICL